MELSQVKRNPSVGANELKSADYSDTKVSQPNQPQPLILSSIDEFKKFFSQHGLPFDAASSREENILANINRLPAGLDHPVIFADRTFVLKAEEKHELPPGYRLQNSKVVGTGTLEFSDGPPILDSLFHIKSEGDLKQLLGFYYTNKPLLWNIDHAVKQGNFPAGDVILQIKELVIADDDTITLPKNIYTDNPTIRGKGNLFFSNGCVTVHKGVAARAVGPLAEAHTDCGFIFSIDEGRAHATGTGAAYSLSDGSIATADGSKAKAFGMKSGSIIGATNGGTGHRHVQGVTATHDAQSTICWTVLSQKMPPYEPGDEKNNPENFAIFKQYMRDLKDLAIIGGDAGASFKLGMYSNKFLGNFFKVSQGSLRGQFILNAYRQGHKEAAYQLAEMNLATGESGYKLTLKHYSDALDTTSEKDVQLKIRLLTFALDVDEEVAFRRKHNVCVVSEKGALNKGTESAFMLGMTEDAELIKVFKKIPNPKLYFLNIAVELGHTDAEYQLGEYFNKSNATIKELNVALDWYKRALVVSDRTNIKEKISQIEAKLPADISQIEAKLPADNCTVQ